jgi:hypothetical protein
MEVNNEAVADRLSEFNRILGGGDFVGNPIEGYTFTPSGIRRGLFKELDELKAECKYIKSVFDLFIKKDPSIGTRYVMCGRELAVLTEAVMIDLLDRFIQRVSSKRWMKELMDRADEVYNGIMYIIDAETGRLETFFIFEVKDFAVEYSKVLECQEYFRVVPPLWEIQKVLFIGKEICV